MQTVPTIWVRGIKLIELTNLMELHCCPGRVKNNQSPCKYVAAVATERQGRVFLEHFHTSEY